MFYYANLLGGLLTSEFPYLLLLFSGYLFSRLGLLQRDGIVALSKLVIEMFLPVYLFIQVARSNNVDALVNNSLIIISNLVMMLVVGLIAFSYAYLTKMNIRYRFTWIVLLCFNDIRRVHTLMVNTFCFHLPDQSTKEKSFCSDTLTNSFVQLFYQEIIMWYVGFNLVRMDRKVTKRINTLAKEYTEGNDYIKIGKKVNNPVDIKEREKLETLEKFAVELTNLNEKKINQATFNELDRAYDKIFNEPKKPAWKEMFYIALRPPIIGLFFGFVVGLIPVIKTGIFNTKTIMFVRIYFLI
jgi:predicted permease